MMSFYCYIVALLLLTGAAFAILNVVSLTQQFFREGLFDANDMQMLSQMLIAAAICLIGSVIVLPA
jgi:peptidoglycan biosynthesis protein MviN/MurJ (putative lipid II flippase)